MAEVLIIKHVHTANIPGVILCRRIRKMNQALYTRQLCTWISNAQTFTTAGTEQKTLQDILQHEHISKVFFDGVLDVQLMESVTRRTTVAGVKFLQPHASTEHSNRVKS
ncbi:hypothetical protein HBH65_175160 [Parastagonospora nodorum]|nr:hypothetical protein HBI02_181590 [Parastagonospora nodorum]KAH4324136.1 hypothetical protein HBI00_170060 [Parastagonospora nodorum]KAH4503035.1 hypothetical protein HBH87_170760 [Parastagonospora nodorum]KAH4566381.1 hypothetical protein HBH83_243000 [Parastagonospora nodorum]KAH4754133.1 hypothetical protein HBH65_175160 [Parastagonospora nodorum]